MSEPLTPQGGGEPPTPAPEPTPAPTPKAPAEPPPPPREGAIAWMAKNSVAANLVMILFLAGGLIMTSQVKQEVFPEFTLPTVLVSVPYPGASPAEVEQGIIRVVEEAVRGVDGVKRVTSTAREGSGSISVELLDSTDEDRALADVKSAVDRITSFPEDAERPTVSLFVNRRQVIALVIYGDLSEEILRQLGERARDDLLADDNVTQADLAGTRPREIAVEVSQSALRTYNLTLEQIATQIRQASVELPGGTLKTLAGERLLRTDERRSFGDEFGDIVLKSDASGARLRVRDVAQVKDTFQETDVQATFNGKPAVQVNVYRVGDETPTQVADAVKAYAKKLAETLPAGAYVDTWNDSSKVYRDRVNLLTRNAIQSLILVFVALALFLELKLAFWVMMGIPTSVIGSFLFLGTFDVSINMVSLFAFIVTLGIVVDDAIVVGDNIYEERERGVPFLKAAIKATRSVAMPVVFSVLTTVAAFLPLLFIEGFSGQFFRPVPIIVCVVLMISLVESLLVLPAHLAHSKPSTTGLFGLIARGQGHVGRGLFWFVNRLYAPTLRFVINHRFSALAFAFALLLAAAGIVGGNHIAFTFMPKVEGDTVKASVRLPIGAPLSETMAVRDRLIATGRAAVAKLDSPNIVLGIYAQVGAPISGRSGSAEANGAHIVDVSFQLVQSDQREVESEQLARAWLAMNRDLVGIDSIAITSAMQIGSGKAVDVQLAHTDPVVLQEASAKVAEALAGFAGTSDINDGFSDGKPQLNLSLTAAGRSLGLTEADLARQVRSAFYGAEALRQQRGRDEVRVMVRLPKVDRETLASFEHLILRAPSGAEIALSEAATVTPGISYTEILRDEGRRVVNVTADVDSAISNGPRIVTRLKEEVLPQILKDFPGLTYSQEGAQRDQREAFGSLKFGFIFALLAIYALLAIPLRSYLQPIVIMTAIPFGFVGALAGHLLMGYELSVMSMMGLVALSGVVVNDSLVMVDAINGLVASGVPLREAVVQAGIRRFRPIMLTTLTTFFGLMPLIFEPSVQARFLIPMALSLGFGVAFATFVTQLLVPSLYLILEDLKRLFGVHSAHDIEEMSLPATHPEA